MPPCWHGLNSCQRSMASTRSPSGIVSRASKRAGVPDLVDVDLGSAGDRFHRLRLVVEVIPAFRIVQAPDHVDAVGGHHEVPVVEVVLLRREDVHRRARLLPGVGRLPGPRATDSEPGHRTHCHRRHRERSLHHGLRLPGRGRPCQLARRALTPSAVKLQYHPTVSPEHQPAVRHLAARRPRDPAHPPRFQVALTSAAQQAGEGRSVRDTMRRMARHAGGVVVPCEARVPASSD